MKNLLIVDDDMYLRKLINTYCELNGLKCDEAESGKKALGKVRKKIMILLS